jgi:hypothetical protein
MTDRSRHPVRWLLLAALIVLASAASVASAETATAASGPVVTFDATSGLASPHQHLVVNGDGSATMRSGQDPELHFRVPHAAVRQIELLMKRMHFNRLKNYYGPRSSTDTPTYDISSRTRTVRTESGTPPAPPKLWAFIGHLYGIQEQATEGFLLRVTVVEDPYLQLTLLPNRVARIDTDSGERQKKLSRRCSGRLRKAARAVHTPAYEPGVLVRGAPRNPPASVELTRDFQAFHVALDRHAPRSAHTLIKRARAAAKRRGC